MNKTDDPIKMEVGKVPAHGGKHPEASRSGEQKLLIFWWHLWMGRSIHVECATTDGKYDVIHSQDCINL